VTPGGTLIAPAICYESAFGGYMAQFVRKGAHVIFVITNDGWWKNTPGYRQHFSFSRLRAVETRRSIVRAANTGISGFISQRGDVVQQSEWWTEDALLASVRFNDALTFYVKHGDYIARISLFMAGLLLLNLIATRLRKGKKNPH
jgi:apolipoprotein N-acyltransferase